MNSVSITPLEGAGITAPQSWRAIGIACGLRYSGRPDLALLVSDTACTAAALFTTNKVKAAHILYDQPILMHNAAGIRAVLVNAGSANACTGDAGVQDCATVAQAVEQTLGLPAQSALVMSTGVIGVRLRVSRIVTGIATAATQLDRTPAAASLAARAIMTTDTYPKQYAVQVRLADGSSFTIGGMAKGSGMIHPNMATMLGVLTTDAAVAPEVLRAALRYVADHSFHCISVDGDTSTNDTLLALANGQAGGPQITELDSPLGRALVQGLLAVAQPLARDVVRDGEGATRLVTIHVRGAADDAAAHQAAMTVATSALVKTALFGADPNWGRVVCALGYSNTPLDPQRLVLWFGGIKVFEHGVPLDFDERAAHQLLDQPEVVIDADLGLGPGTATVWTCDFSYQYVKINAEYRT